MKRFLFLFVMLVCFISCSNKKENKEEMSKVGLFLSGEHKLHKLNESTGSETHSSFFLFSGSTSSTSGPIVSFAWEKDGVNILSTLPFNKIRIKLVEKIDTPTIKFRWRINSGYVSNDDINQIMNENIIYAVIYAQAEDWPQEINLPMNKQ